MEDEKIAVSIGKCRKYLFIYSVKKKLKDLVYAQLISGNIADFLSVEYKLFIPRQFAYTLASLVTSSSDRNSGNRSAQQSSNK